MLVVCFRSGVRIIPNFPIVLHNKYKIQKRREGKVKTNIAGDDLVVIDTLHSLIDDGGFLLMEDGHLQIAGMIEDHSEGAVALGG